MADNAPSTTGNVQLKRRYAMEDEETAEQRKARQDKAAAALKGGVYKAPAARGTETYQNPSGGQDSRERIDLPPEAPAEPAKPAATITPTAPAANVKPKASDFQGNLGGYTKALGEWRKKNPGATQREALAK